MTVTVGSIQDGAGFYVEDDRSGVPEAEHDQVFESGYSSDYDGTGFGLAIASQVARARAWEIGASESDEGGARFEITEVEER